MVVADAVATRASVRSWLGRAQANGLECWSEAELNDLAQVSTLPAGVRALARRICRWCRAMPATARGPVEQRWFWHAGRALRAFVSGTTRDLTKADVVALRLVAGLTQRNRGAEWRECRDPEAEVARAIVDELAGRLFSSMPQSLPRRQT